MEESRPITGEMYRSIEVGKRPIQIALTPPESGAAWHRTPDELSISEAPATKVATM
jgi:hypothetical protein